MVIARQQQGTMLTKKIQYEAMLWVGSPMALEESISRESWRMKYMLSVSRCV